VTATAEKLTGFALFAIIFCVYLTTLSPSISIGDSGELITAAATLGVPHPPGYPLWCLCLHPFSWLPFGSPAVGVNLGVAFFSALASWIFFRLAVGPCGLRLWIGAPLTLVHGLGPTLWGQSVVAEVYSLNLVIVLWLALLHLRSDRKSLLAYVSGLSLISHGGNLALLLPVVWGRLRRSLAEGVRPSGWVRTIGWVLLGMTPLLYLPIRSATSPPLDWGHPADLERLLAHITRGQYGGFRWPGVDVVLQQLAKWISASTHVASGVAWGLAAVAIIRLRRDHVTQTLIAWLLLAGPVSAVVLSGLLRGEQLIESEVFLLPSFSFLLLLAAQGLQSLAARIAGITGVAVAAWAVWLFIVVRPVCDKSDNYIAGDYGRALLAPLPADAVLFVSADHEAFPLIYLQAVERMRTDVSLRVIGAPDSADAYGRPAESATRVVERRERPIFVTLPKPPFDPGACTPNGLAFRYGPPEAAPPRWRDNALRHRASAKLGYFERGTLAAVSFHHAAYLFAVGRTDLALSLVEATSGRVPDNARMLNDLATLLAGAGQIERAERLWLRAVEADVHYVLAWENLVRARLALGNPTGARDAVRTGLSENPSARSLADLARRIDQTEP